MNAEARERATLDGVAKGAFGYDVRLEEWTRMPLGYRLINQTTASLERVEFVARDPTGARVRATVVAKTLRCNVAGEVPERARFAPSSDPAHWNYWRREFDAYGSPLLNELPAGLRAPVCYARELHDDATATLWLEYQTGAAASDWEDDSFYRAARALGCWQGAFVVAPARLPRDAWLCRSFLRDWSYGDAQALAQLCDEEAWSRPEVRASFGPSGFANARDLAERHATLLAAAERAPAVLGHNDLWAKNLFADARGTVAIDWSMLGIASLAEDVANLVYDSVWMFELASRRLPEVEAAVLAGYCEGLQSVGSSLAPAEVENAFRRVAALRFGTLGGPLVRSNADPALQERLAARYARPFEDVFAIRTAVVERALAFLPTVKS